MKTIHCVIYFLFLMIASTINSTAQEDRYDAITDSIEKKVKLLTNYTYDISGIEIDKSVNNQSVSHGKIKDPYGTLAGCFIFLAQDTDDPVSTRPKGFIGIYRIKTDSIIWRSILLSNEFADGVSGSVDATDELNRDGKVEIVIGQAKGTGGQLWIFSWDGAEGKLITQLDSSSDSNIMYWGDDYDLKDVNGDGIYEIQGEWYKGDGSDAKIKVRYTWNGSLFGNWGKAPKVPPSSKKK